MLWKFEVSSVYTSPKLVKCLRKTTRFGKLWNESQSGYYERKAKSGTA